MLWIMMLACYQCQKSQVREIITKTFISKKKISIWYFYTYTYVLPLPTLRTKPLGPEFGSGIKCLKFSWPWEIFLNQEFLPQNSPDSRCWARNIDFRGETSDSEDFSQVLENSGPSIPDPKDGSGISDGQCHHACRLLDFILYLFSYLQWYAELHHDWIKVSLEWPAQTRSFLLWRPFLTYR